jgi:hypothetical protein
LIDGVVIASESNDKQFVVGAILAEYLISVAIVALDNA